MDAPVLYDATTLRNFAAAGRLDVLIDLHTLPPHARWTDRVFHEILDCADLGIDECADILASTSWLGSPLPLPDAAAHLIVQRHRTRLGGGAGFAHAGEAECLYFAEELGGAVATDDWPAYDLVAKRLGNERVMDTIDILRSAAAHGIVTPRGALQIFDAIGEAGRRVRGGHPLEPTEDYFR